MSSNTSIDFFETFVGPKGNAAISQSASGIYLIYHNAHRPVCDRDYSEGMRATLAEARTFALRLVGLMAPEPPREKQPRIQGELFNAED